MASSTRRRNFVINLASQYGAVAFAIVHGFVLVPLYLAHIPTSLYGAWLATGSLLAWIELVDPGLSAVLQRRVALHAGGSEPAQLGRVVGTGLVLNAAIAVLPLLFVPLAWFVPGWVRIDGHAAEQLTLAFQLAVVGLSVAVAAYGLHAINLGLQLSGAVAFVFALGSVVGVATTVLLLIEGWGLISLPLGLLARSSTWFLGHVFVIRAWCARTGVPLKVSRQEQRDVRGEVAFTFLSRFGIALLDRVEPFIAATMISPAAAALLVLNGRAFEPVKMVTSRVAVAMSAPLAHLLGQEGTDRAARLVRRTTVAVLMTAAVAVSCVVAMNGVFVHLWVGTEFNGGLRLTYVQGLAAVLWIGFAFLNQTVFTLGGVRQSALAAVVEGVAKLVLVFVCVRAFGLVGIPLGGCLASLMVTMWYLPAMVARLLQASQKEMVGVNLRAIAFAAILGLGGAWLSGALMHLETWNWPRFILCAFLLGATTSAIAICVTPTLRSDFTAVLRRTRRSVFA